MRLTAALSETLKQTTPASLDDLSEELPEALVVAALRSAGHQAKRRRSLPPEVVVWLAVAMAVFRDRSIEAVAAHLKLTARTTGSGTGQSSSALVQARDRVGAAPVRAVFEYSAAYWALPSAHEHAWRGLSVFAVDGSTMRVADTPENEATFGRPASAAGRGKSGYPQVRLVTLMAVRSHLLLGASFGPYRTSEGALARELWPQLPDASVVIIDRGFVDYVTFHEIVTRGADRHFLIRAKKNLRWRVVSKLGRGDDLVQLTVSRNARRKDPSIPETMMARVIRYRRKGFRPQRLITSLIDSEAYPAEEIRDLYHERWEIELGYDEIKTHTLEREESHLRSKSPERVSQEMWGLLIAYNLVRRQIERFADANEVSPHRVSYRGTLLLVRNVCVCAATGVGSVQKLLDTMNSEMKLLILPPRRDRRYPRAVKIKMSNYPRNTGKSRRAAR